MTRVRCSLFGHKAGYCSGVGWVLLSDSCEVDRIRSRELGLNHSRVV